MILFVACCIWNGCNNVLRAVFATAVIIVQRASAENVVIILLHLERL